MKISFPFFLFILGFLELVACKDKTKSIYEGCCGTEPTTDAFLVHADTFDNQGNLIDTAFKANVLIPNLFVPGTDYPNSWNTTFRIGFGPGIFQVASAVYSSPDGEILFKREFFLPDQDDLTDGWDGKKSDGSYFYGVFNYRVVIEFIDGQTKVYSSNACSYKCGENGFPVENVPFCLFPSQNNGNGLPDQTQPGDSWCF